MSIGCGAHLLADLVEQHDLVHEPGVDAGAAGTSSREAPARSSAWTSSRRPSCGTRTEASSASRSSAEGSPTQLNPASFFSRLRSAFCSASVKLRPMAIASPTLFMCVVSSWLAAGNFSNANRGTLTTT